MVNDLERFLDVKKYRGNKVALIGRMNSGKTGMNVNYLRRVVHTGNVAVAFTNDANKRDPPDKIVSEGDYSFPAHMLRCGHLIEDAFRTISELEDKWGRIIDVVSFGESQFLPKQQFLELMFRLSDISQKNPKLVIYEVLDPDMRGEPFDKDLLWVADYHVGASAICKMLHNGAADGSTHRCGSTDAEYNPRLLRKDIFGFEEGFDVSADFVIDYPDNSVEEIRGEYKFAPYFDKTVRVEQTQDSKTKHKKDFIYVNACKNCFKTSEVPGREETIKVLTYIMDLSLKGKPATRDDISRDLGDTPHLTDIVEFLVNERRVVFDDGFRHVMKLEHPRYGFTYPDPSQVFPTTSDDGKKIQLYDFEKNDLIWVPVPKSDE